MTDKQKKKGTAARQEGTYGITTRQGGREEKIGALWQTFSRAGK